MERRAAYTTRRAGCRPVFYDLFIQKGEWRGILAFDIMLSITVGFYLLFNFVHHNPTQPAFDPGLLTLKEREASASDCFERQNINFFSLCSFFGALKVDTVAAEDVCGLNSSLAFALGPNEFPMSCDRL